MTTNDTNGYLPYDDDTFEKNLGYHDGYTERERERMEELVNENKEAFDTAIKQADDGQVTIAVRRQRDERLPEGAAGVQVVSYSRPQQVLTTKVEPSGENILVTKQSTRA